MRSSSKLTYHQRDILSCVSSLYDLLGLVTPILLPAKYILQCLCKMRLGWDEAVDVKSKKAWLEWLRGMEGLNDITFDRCVKPTDGVPLRLTHLHVFCDASEVGYGAVSYIRYPCIDGGAKCALLMAKSRVAPLKVRTIPRMELSAAMLAAKLGSLLIKEMKLVFESSTFWTDSTTVRSYLHSTSGRFKTLVANRVETIKSLTPNDQWRYIPTKINPADLASREVNPARHDWAIWKYGPQLLGEPSERWLEVKLEIVSDLEIKHDAKVNIIASDSPTNKLCLYYSD